MKIIIAPNSFKGCMNSLEVANCIEKGLYKALPDAKIDKIPLADGGDGTLDIIKKTQDCKSYKKKVIGPLWDKIEVKYLISQDTAVIELAKVAGTSLLPKKLRNPLNTTTYGIGELIQVIVKEGTNKIIFGVGGSATCDGGAGILAALGVKFLDESGNSFIPVGGTLIKIKKIKALNKLLLPDIVVLADVSNPLVGEKGAAKIYAEQKGASQKEIKILEDGLVHFSKILNKVGLSKNPLMGAAGGVSFGLSAIGANVVSGTKSIMALCDFENIASDANLIITGEGEINENTKYGKVVWEVMQFGKTHNIPIIGITGSIGKEIESFYNEGLTSVFSLAKGPISLSESISESCEFLNDIAFRIGKLLYQKI